MNQRFKIVKTKPDKNGAVIIAIKADEHGEFNSREEALHSLYPVSTQQSEDDEFVATGCGGGVKRILGDSGIRLKWKEDKDGE